MNSVSRIAALLPRIWGARGARLIAGDALVIGLLAAGVVAASLPRPVGKSAPRAQIVVSGSEAMSLDLSRDGVHDVLGPIGVTRVEVRGGKVRVLSSPCPQQICRHGGWIGAPGSLLVCLPNEMVVRVPEAPGDETAAVSR